jgi:hypothetical protein
MKDHKLDILCITHAGGTARKMSFILQQARKTYSNYYIQHIPIPDFPRQQKITNMKEKDKRVGGVLVIGSPLWAPIMGQLHTDSSELGLLTRLNLNTLINPTTIIISYVPAWHKMAAVPGNQHTLMNQAHLYLSTTNRNLDPYQYIAITTTAWINTARSEGREVVLLGDFNNHWIDRPAPPPTTILTPSHLKLWIHTLGLENSVSTQRAKQGLHLPPTYVKNESKTTPDHIFTTPTLTSATTDSGTCTCPGGHQFSDHHRTTWITLDLPPPPPQAHPKNPSLPPN